MNQATGNGSRRTVVRVLVGAGALLFAIAIIQPEVADDAHSGGGRGGFHCDGGGFHGGGFHHGFRHFHGGFGIGGIYAPYWWSYGYPYSYYGYYGNYPDHKYFGYDPGSSYYGDHPGYGYYSYDPGSSYYGNHPAYGHGSQPNARQTWYYCSDPAGYYPYVAQCKTRWQSVPAS
jgi:hypothetical protein